MPFLKIVILFAVVFLAACGLPPNVNYVDSISVHESFSIIDHRLGVRCAKELAELKGYCVVLQKGMSGRNVNLFKTARKVYVDEDVVYFVFSGYGGAVLRKDLSAEANAYISDYRKYL